MLAAYFKEVRGLETLETNEGFITYKLDGNECWIADIYVRPEFRKQGKGSHLADQVALIALENGCTYLAGTVNPRFPACNESIQAMFAYGFKLLGWNADLKMIVLTKDLIGRNPHP